jgi:hypothetical protein
MTGNPFCSGFFVFNPPISFCLAWGTSPGDNIAETKKHKTGKY